MENEELALQLRTLKEDVKSSVQSDDDMKLLLIEQKNNDDDMGAGMQQNDDTGLDIYENKSTCNYPDCLLASGGPPLDVCQDTCGG